MEANLKLNPKLFGSSWAGSNPESPLPSGFRYLANPKCARHGESIPHPDSIQVLDIGAGPVPLDAKFQWDRPEVSWKRGDEQVTIPAHTKYVLIFKNTQGELIEYTDMVTHEGNRI